MSIFEASTLPRGRLHCKPKTNADRIRAMSDEGMFDLFTEDMDGERFFYCPACRGKTEEECFASNCADCFMAWLKQEVDA